MNPQLNPLIIYFSLDENWCLSTSWKYVSKHPYMLVNPEHKNFFLLCAETLEVKRTLMTEQWQVINVVFILGIFEASNVETFPDARVVHKYKVFGWQNFLILICVNTVLHTLGTSTSCCSIFPGGRRINFTHLRSNDIMWLLLRFIQQCSSPTCSSLRKWYTFKIYYFFQLCLSN